MNNVLYLNYYTHFSTPTNETLKSQLLQRLGVPPLTSSKIRNHKHSWIVPIDQEEIRHINPDCIILSTTDPIAFKKAMAAMPALQDIEAIKRGNIFFVDEAVQESPTQYTVLTYYDLCEALVSALGGISS